MKYNVTNHHPDPKNMELVPEDVLSVSDYCEAITAHDINLADAGSDDCLYLGSQDIVNAMSRNWPQHPVVHLSVSIMVNALSIVYQKPEGEKIYKGLQR